MGCGVQMGAFRWVTSSDPKVVVGPPFRTIVDHGIQVGIHGDGVHIAPLNPWPHIYFAVTGVNSFGAKVNGDQQLTRQEALRLFTRGNSWFLRMEDKIGSIETGQARRSRRPRSRLLHGAGRADQADQIAADDRRRQDRSRTLSCLTLTATGSTETRRRTSQLVVISRRHHDRQSAFTIVIGAITSHRR